MTVTGKTTNAGDGLGMKVPCQLFFLEEERFIEKCRLYLFFHFSSLPSEAWNLSMFNPPANSRAFSLSIGPLIGAFSLRKIRNHLCSTLLNSTYFSGFTFFEGHCYTFEGFCFCSFSMSIRYFWHAEKGSNILMGSSFLQFFECLILCFFYDFFSARRFVAMEAMIVKFQNVV